MSHSRKLSYLVALLAMAASTASVAQQKPLVSVGGQTRQLPSNTALGTQPSTTAAASINIPPGVAPTTPNNGDCWSTSEGLFCRSAGQTRGPMAGLGSVGTWTAQQYFGSGAPGNNWLNTYAYGDNAAPLVGLNNSNGVGVAGAARTSTNLGAGGISIGSLGFGFADGSSAKAANDAWGGYFECRAYASSTGYCEGVEINAANLRNSTVVALPYNAQQPGKIGALALASGGSCISGTPCYNPASGATDLQGRQASSALLISTNSANFNVGVLFQCGSVGTTDCAGNGAGDAIAMYPGANLSWYAPGNSQRFSFGAANSTLAGKMLWSDSGLLVQNGGGTSLFQMYPGTGAVNGLLFNSAGAGGAPVMQAMGSDGSIDLRLSSKGSGVNELGKGGSFGTFASTPNYVGAKSESTVVAVEGSSGSPAATSGAVGLFQKFSSATAFNVLAGMAVKSSTAANARATAVYGEAVDNVGGTSTFVEGGRLQAVLAGGDAGSAYGGICAAGTNTTGPTNPAYIVGCEGEVTKQVGSDAPTYGSFNQNSFSASFVATNGVGVASAKKADAAIIVNPYSVSKFRTGLLLSSAVDDAGVAAASGTSLVAGLDFHLSSISYASLWAPNNAPVRFSNAAGSAGVNVLNLDANNDLQVGVDVTGGVVIGSGLRLKKVTVAALPTCSAAAEGTLYAVTDANSATFNAAVAGGGSNHVMAYCNGSQWTVH